MIWLGSFWSRPPGKPSIVSIAKWDPPWFKGPSIRLFAPQSVRGSGISHTKDRRDWIESYKSILSERGRIRDARRQLDALLSECENVLLACWCKKGRSRQDGSYSGSFCHRLLVGRLLSRLGYTVEVMDLECSRCSGPVSFDGGVSSGEFVCRSCLG